MEGEKITLRGVTVSKEALEEKYQFDFTETEWKVFSSYLLRSWADDSEGLRKLAFDHIRKSMEQMGYKVSLKGKDLVFEKKE